MTALTFPLHGLQRATQFFFHPWTASCTPKKTTIPLEVMVSSFWMMINHPLQNGAQTNRTKKWCLDFQGYNNSWLPFFWFAPKKIASGGGVWSLQLTGPTSLKERDHMMAMSPCNMLRKVIRTKITPLNFENERMERKYKWNDKLKALVHPKRNITWMDFR